MSYLSRLENKISQSLKEQRVCRQEKINSLINSGVFIFCNCSDCDTKECYSKAIKLQNTDEFFFRVMTTAGKEREFKCTLIVFKYTSEARQHKLGRMISIDDFFDALNEKDKQSIIFNLNLIV
jgi:hypothetical protein